MLGLFRGGGPTVVRAMALNMGMLASNDQAKEMIEAAGFAKGGSTAVLGGATIAGAAFACVCVCVFVCVWSMCRSTRGCGWVGRRQRVCACMHALECVCVHRHMDDLADRGDYIPRGRPGIHAQSIISLMVLG